jgi:hypothetical protein
MVVLLLRHLRRGRIEVFFAASFKVRGAALWRGAFAEIAIFGLQSFAKRPAE